MILYQNLFHLAQYSCHTLTPRLNERRQAVKQPVRSRRAKWLEPKPREAFFSSAPFSIYQSTWYNCSPASKSSASLKTHMPGRFLRLHSNPLAVPFAQSLAWSAIPTWLCRATVSNLAVRKVGVVGTAAEVEEIDWTWGGNLQSQSIGMTDIVVERSER